MYPVWIGTADNECVSIELNLLKDEVSALTISQCLSWVSRLINCIVERCIY